MKDNRPPTVVLDRLRANLSASGIALTPADLEGIVASGMLSNVGEFEAAVAGVPVDTVPVVLNSQPPDPPANLPVRDSAVASVRDSITEVALRVRAGTVSPVELLEQSLERIGAREIELNAFQVVLVERARLAAKRAEIAINTRDWRGPRHGIPIAIKDLFAMAGTVRCLIPLTMNSCRFSGGSFERSAKSFWKQPNTEVEGGLTQVVHAHCRTDVVFGSCHNNSSCTSSPGCA